MLNRGRRVLEAALPIFRGRGDLLGESAILNNLSILNFYAGKIGEAQLELLETALKLDRQAGSLWGECIALSNLGHRYLRLGQYEKAAACHRKTLQIRRELGNPDRAASSLRHLGVVAARQGKFEKALDFFHQSVQAAQESDNCMAQALTQLQEGVVLTEIGRLTAAERSLRKARAALRSVSSSGYLLEVEAGLIQLALAQGNRSEAGSRAVALYPRLNGKPFKTSDTPEFIFWACYQGLKAAADPRATAVLKQAKSFLQTQLDMIQADSLRQSFLENVPYNRKIWECAE